MEPAILQRENPLGPGLYHGCEVHLTPENLSSVLAKPAAFTLNGVNCLLLELPDRIVPPMVDPAIEALTD
jgi:hypothetical protein